MRTLLFIFVLFQLSCSTASIFKKAPKVIPIELQKLEGDYSNAETKKDSTFGLTYFTEHITPFPIYYDSMLTPSLKSSKIRIKFIAPRRLKIELIEANSTTFSKEFSFIIQEKQLYIKKNRWHWGIPLLLYKQQHEKLHLWLDKQNNLVVFVDGSTSGALFIIGFGSPIKRKLHFQRLE